jgi:hypothetical protein
MGAVSSAHEIGRTSSLSNRGQGYDFKRLLGSVRDTLSKSPRLTHLVGYVRSSTAQ